MAVFHTKWHLQYYNKIKEEEQYLYMTKYQNFILLIIIVPSTFFDLKRSIVSSALEKKICFIVRIILKKRTYDLSSFKLILLRQFSKNHA